MRIIYAPALALALLASGCSSVPTEGPSASDIVAERSAPVQRFELVDLDMNVAQVLAGRRADKTIASFGDYRPSSQLRIGIGDQVTVTIWEAAAGGLFSAPLLTDKFSTGSKSATIPPQIVDRDGMITVPYAGQVHVAGHTPKEVQAAVEQALEGKAIQPQVLVDVTRSPANTASVLGEVVQGARVPLSVKGDRILDVIAEAGGVKAPVSETFVELTRGKRTARVALSRVVADHREDIYVQPGDVITVVRDPQTFIAYGATGRNAEIPFDAEGINLNQAIAKAAGLLDYRADPEGVFLFRFEPESVARVLRPNSPLVQPGKLTPFVYRLNLRDANSLFVAQRFPIFNKDVIYVSNAPLSDVQKVMEIFNLAVTPAASAASIYSVTK
ncbi:MAG TPA: polysaccharide biosynthesis/export family protein [Roseiarcus sp.]|nr:polysaccharide biosynthesis/export family protein [Roseiarcus sp.]